MYLLSLNCTVCAAQAGSQQRQSGVGSLGFDRAQQSAVASTPSLAAADDATVLRAVSFHTQHTHCPKTDCSCAEVPGVRKSRRHSAHAPRPPQVLRQQERADQLEKRLESLQAEHASLRRVEISRVEQSALCPDSGFPAARNR